MFSFPYPLFYVCSFQIDTGPASKISKVGLHCFWERQFSINYKWFHLKTQKPSVYLEPSTYLLQLHEVECRNKCGWICNWHACVEGTVLDYFGFPVNENWNLHPPLKVFEFFGIKLFRGGNKGGTPSWPEGRAECSSSPLGPSPDVLVWIKDLQTFHVADFS